MAFQELSLKAKQHDYVEFSGLSSAGSLPCLSKFCFSSLKLKSMSSNHNFKLGYNNFTQRIDISDFVPGFRSNISYHSCDISTTWNSANNVKKIVSCPQFSTMNILSCLVGGFVGSKSQVGCLSMQGDRLQIWDLVLQKLLEIMDSDKIDQKKVEPNHDSNLFADLNYNCFKVEQNNKSIKQSYADVAKKICVPVNNYNKQAVTSYKKNMDPKNRRKQPVLLHYDFCRRQNFGQSGKKISFHDMNAFRSSRWSNSRRKHFRKGIEKLNRRDEREAARDGLEFINQELRRNYKSDFNNMLPATSNKNSSYRPNNICRKEISNSRVNSLEGNISIIHDNGQRETQKYNSLDITGNFNKIESVNFDSKVEFSAIISQVCEDGFRHRLGSVCSVDSDDSFIIFEKSDSDGLISQFCFNDIDVLTDDDCDDSSVSTSSSSDFESETNMSVLLFSDSNKIHTNNVVISHDESERNHLCDKNKIITGKRISNESSLLENEVHWKTTCSKSKEVNVSNNCVKDLELINNSKYCNKNCNNINCQSILEGSVENYDCFETFDSGCGELQHDDGYKLKSELDSDDDHEDLDEIYSAVLSPYPVSHSYSNTCWLEEVNSEWNKKFNEVIEKPDHEKLKKVHFPPSDKLASVKVMVTWDFALRSSRIGFWEQLARDTMRFQKRIQCVNEVIQHVFNKNHREKIWKERFLHMLD